MPEVTQITPLGAARAYWIARRGGLKQIDSLRLAHALAGCLGDDREVDEFFARISAADRHDAASDDFVNNKASALKPFSGAQDTVALLGHIKHEGMPTPPKRPGRDYERFLRRNPQVARIKLEH